MLVRVQSWALDDQSLTAKRLRLFFCLEPNQRFERKGKKKALDERSETGLIPFSANVWSSAHAKA
jgi:hypothetical protein